MHTGVRANCTLPRARGCTAWEALREIPKHWQHRLKAKGLGPECCSRDLQCILPFTDSLQEETAGHSGDEESTDWGLHFLFTPEGSTANRRFCL